MLNYPRKLNLKPNSIWLIVVCFLSCGPVVDVNKLLCAQRMRMKKRLIRALEAEIRKVSSLFAF